MITLRPARPGDGPALTALDLAVWSPDVTPGPRPDADRSFFGGRTRPEDVLVAEEDGGVLGYVMLHQAIPLPSHEHVLEINGLNVSPGHRGRGIGRRLLEAAQRDAAARGVRKVTLRVLGTNAVARSLYESCGFVVEGVLRGEFHLAGHDVDDVLMAWWV